MRVAALPVLSRQPAASRLLSWLLSPLFALALSMVALAVFIPSFGDFPINDDWLYAQTVLGLSERGQLSLPAWGASSFVLQAYWGALFVKLLGFSHGALRVSTMLLAAVGVLGFYHLLRQLLDPP